MKLNIFCNFFGVGVSTLLIIEFLLHLLIEPRYGLSMVFDSKLGYRGPRDSIVEIRGQRIYFNPLGFRDLEYDIHTELENGSNRITVLGGSVAEAPKLDEAVIYTHWMEDVLNSALKKTSTVFKFAATDWSAYQKILSYMYVAKELKPKVVVLEFDGVNEFKKNGILFSKTGGDALSNFRPYIENDPNLQPLSIFLLSLVAGSDLKESYSYTIYSRPIIRGLRMYSMLYRIWDSYFQGSMEVERLIAPNFEKGCDPLNQLYLDLPTDTTAIQSIHAVGLLARKFVSLKEAGQTFLAVYIPSRREILDRDWNLNIEPEIKRCSPKFPIHRRQPEILFWSAFRGIGIEVVSLYEAFQKYKNPEDLYDGAGNLTPIAHRMVGEHVALYLYHMKEEELGGKK